MNLVNHPWFNTYLVDDLADSQSGLLDNLLGAVEAAASIAPRYRRTEQPTKTSEHFRTTRQRHKLAPGTLKRDAKRRELGGHGTH